MTVVSFHTCGPQELEEIACDTGWMPLRGAKCLASARAVSTVTPPISARRACVGPARQRFHDQPGTELGTHAVHVVIGGMLADVKPGQGCAHTCRMAIIISSTVRPQNSGAFCAGHRPAHHINVDRDIQCVHAPARPGHGISITACMPTHFTSSML